MPEIPELGQAPDQTLNQPLETLGLTASSLGGETRHQLYIHLQDTVLARMVLVLTLHFSAISDIISSACELAFTLCTARPLPAPAAR